MPTPPTELLLGRDAFEQLEGPWASLVLETDAPVFQSHPWARAWLEHLGGDAEPWLLTAGDPPRAILPLACRRMHGLRVLTLIGHGISDYLGALTADSALAGALARRLRQEAGRVDLIDLKGLCFDDSAGQSFALELGRPAVRRVYERCPVIDTRGDWNTYLLGRRKKFRANLKRAARRTLKQGTVAVTQEPPTPALFDELVEVERQSWKWEHGLASLRNPSRRSFLRDVLLESGLALELWTCRIDDELAAFALVFPTRRARLYYLPSFRAQYSDTGTYLLSEIVQECFRTPCEEFDFLQGDEGYKRAWATRERVAHQVVAAGWSPLGSLALAGVRLRWWLARSEGLGRIRRRVLTRWRTLGGA